MIRRIKEAIKVLRGEETTEEGVLSSELRLMTARLEVANECVSATDAQISFIRKQREVDKHYFESKISKLEAIVNNRRNKVKDLKRIITTMKEKETAGASDG